MLPPISALDRSSSLAARVRADLDGKTKPPGSLGRLEELALQAALVQQSARPTASRCLVMVFAADHGVVDEGVSPFPQAVTAQMVQNFLAGGAAISVLAECLQAELRVVDAGVVTPCPPHPALLDRRIGPGTGNLARGPAMSLAQAEQAIAAGIDCVASFDAQVFVFGEMGIGNTCSASALMHAGTGLPAAQCVGRGTGLDDAGLAHKIDVVERAVTAQGRSDEPLELLRRYGGFEIAMMCGAMLGAAASRRLFVVDGFIATAAASLAFGLAPACRDYAVFAHVSAESPHRRWLQHLGVDPLFDLGLRLGEGSGAILALPLLRSACAILDGMASFADAGVSQKLP